MLMDKRVEFCDATSLNGLVAAATTVIGNVIDTRASLAPNTLVGMGVGRPVYLVIEIDTAVTSGGAATVAFSLVTDAAAALTASPTVHFTTSAFALASLTAGALLAVVMLPPDFTYEAHMGVRATVATADLTGGSVSAFLTHTPPRWTPFADNVT